MHFVSHKIKLYRFHKKVWNWTLSCKENSTTLRQTLYFFLCRTIHFYSSDYALVERKYPSMPRTIDNLV